MSRERLRSPRLESRPKSVDRAATFRDNSGRAGPGQPLNDELQHLIDLTAAGHILPDRFYRGGIDRDSDGLLEQTGIKHLHLGGPSSDVLLFLVEYDDRVVLLEINDHKHFRTEPVGGLLRALHDSLLNKADRDAVSRRAERLERSRRIVRTGLRPRRSR